MCRIKKLLFISLVSVFLIGCTDQEDEIPVNDSALRFYPGVKVRSGGAPMPQSFRLYCTTRVLSHDDNLVFVIVTDSSLAILPPNMMSDVDMSMVDSIRVAKRVVDRFPESQEYRKGLILFMR